MFHRVRRTAVLAGVEFCDACVEVTTAAQRADRIRDRTRTQALTWVLPR